MHSVAASSSPRRCVKCAKSPADRQRRGREDPGARVLLDQGSRSARQMSKGSRLQPKPRALHAQRARALAGVGARSDCCQRRRPGRGARAAHCADLGAVPSPAHRARSPKRRQRAGERGTVGLHGGVQVQPGDAPLVAARAPPAPRAARLLQRAAEPLHRRRTARRRGQLAPRIAAAAARPGARCSMLRRRTSAARSGNWCASSRITASTLGSRSPKPSSFSARSASSRW